MKNETQNSAQAIPALTEYLTTLAERNGVDYKKKYSSDKADIYNSVKVFAAMANSGGGLIIYGVDEKAKNLIGIDNAQLKALNPANLGQALAKFLNPVPTFTTEFIEYEGKDFGFVTVEGIINSPVLITKTITDESGVLLRAGAVFIRSHTSSLEVNSEIQMRNILDGIVANSVKAKVADWISLFDKNENSRTEFDPTIIAKRKASEFAGFDEKTPIREAFYQQVGGVQLTEKEKQLLSSIRAKYIGIVWPFYGVNTEKFKSGKIEQGYITYYDDERKYFSMVEKNSAYTCSTLIEDEYSQDGNPSNAKYKNAIVTGLTVNLVTVACKLGWEFLNKSDWEKIELSYAIHNIRGRKLIVADFNRGDFYTDKICIDNSARAKVVLSKCDLDKQIETIMDLLISLFSYFSWNDVGMEQLKKDVGVVLSATNVETCSF